jgi:hypothetical protein
MKSRAALAAALLAVAFAGCGSATTTTTSPPKAPTAAESAAIQRTTERLHAHEAAETKRKAAKRAALKKSLHVYEQSPEYKKIQAEMRQGEEYERAHKPEAEAKEQEYEQHLKEAEGG